MGESEIKGQGGAGRDARLRYYYSTSGIPGFAGLYLGMFLLLWSSLFSFESEDIEKVFPQSG